MQVSQDKKEHSEGCWRDAGGERRCHSELFTGNLFKKWGWERPSVLLPGSAGQCGVRAPSVPLLGPAFVNQGFVCRSQEVVKLCQNQAQRQLNKKKPWFLTLPGSRSWPRANAAVLKGELVCVKWQVLFPLIASRSSVGPQLFPLSLLSQTTRNGSIWFRFYSC